MYQHWICIVCNHLCFPNFAVVSTLLKFVNLPAQPLTTTTSSQQKKLLTDTETQTDPWIAPNPNPPSQHDSPPHRNPATTPEEGAIGNARPLSRESDFDADVESDAFSERSLAMHLNRVLQDLTLVRKALVLALLDVLALFADDAS